MKHASILPAILAVLFAAAPATLALADVGYDDCSHAPETTVCGPYVNQHIHDLGASLASGTKVKIRYTPGWSSSCSGTATFYCSTDRSTWTQIATQAYPSGHGTYSIVVAPARTFRYIKVYVPNCYVDFSSAGLYVEKGGTYQTSQTLDFGVGLNANTPVIVRGTPGFTSGCSGTAAVYASANGTSWTLVGAKTYTSYKRAGGNGWRDYKLTVQPGFVFRYLKVAHSNCYCDAASAEVSPYGYREYYALIVGGQTDPDAVSRQHDPWYTWYWNVTSSVYGILTNNYQYPADHIYFLFEENGSGGLGKDTQHIHDTDSQKAAVEEALRHVSRRVDSDDLFFVFWVSHGNSSSFALPGTDFAHSGLDALLDNIAGRQVLAFQPCRSGCVIDDISQTNRVILTSVACSESNSSAWAETFRDAISGSATMDGNGDVTLASAFTYAASRIQNSSEHPLLDDNGDKVGHRYNESGYNPNDPTKDGFRAAATTLGHLISTPHYVEPSAPELATEQPDQLPDLRPTAGPNPMRLATVISFRAPSAGRVRLVICDVTGRIVRTVHDGPARAGLNQLVWDRRDDAGRSVGAGVYFYRLEAGAARQGNKLIVVE